MVNIDPKIAFAITGAILIVFAFFIFPCIMKNKPILAEPIKLEEEGFERS